MDSMQQYSRRKFLRFWTVVTMATLGGGVLAACTKAITPTAPAVGTANAPIGTVGSGPVGTSASGPVGTTASGPVWHGDARCSRYGCGWTSQPGCRGAFPRREWQDPFARPRRAGGLYQVPQAFKSVNAVPGKNSKVRALIVSYNAPPTPRDQNRWWQELEKRLGITFEPILQPADGYPQRLATILAGGDIPDLTFLYFEQVPDQYKVIQQGAYADLTEYLSGDGLKQFPNLALFPDYLWKNARTNGKLYGAPRALLQVGAQAHWRKDWGEKFGTPSPKNADEFLDLMTKFTKSDPDGNGRPDTYGIHTIAQFTFALGFFMNMFRVPNTWSRNTDGTLLADIEAPEFRQTVEYMKKLFDAGIFHPDTAAGNRTQRKDLITNSKVGLVLDALTGWAGTAGFRETARQLANNRNINITTLVPMGHDGGKANTYLGTGFTGYAAIPAKVGQDKARTQELLRVIDYFAAPFGSEEWSFLNYGIEGVHHTVDASGARVINDLGLLERASGDLQSLCNPMPVYYYSLAGDAQEAQIAVRDCLAIGVPNPAQGLFSPANATNAGRLNQLRIDRIGSIVQGREPLSALDTFVKDWRSQGGDQMRKEYEQGLQGQ